MKKINVGVVGIGNLGQHHFRIYHSMSDLVNLVAVADVDENKLEKYRKVYPEIYFTNDFKKILDKVDAISLVVPTSLHYKIGKEILIAKKHLLIEKPITTTVDEAEELVQIAQQNNLILQVGHVERFNPVVQATREFIKNPRFIESVRLGSFAPRVADVGVVLDLMIHDIDIVLCYVASKLESVEAYGAKVFTDKEDIVKARLRFENSIICDLTASRISMYRYRKMHIFQDDSYVSIDFMRQHAKIYRKKHKDAKNFQDIEVLKPKIKREEPLKLELQHFINSIIHNKSPEVTGEHAKNALSVAIEIIQKLKF
jgi:predicted dehydrogenase